MAAIDEKEYTKEFDLGIWKKLIPLLARYKWFFAGVIGFELIWSAVEVFVPLFQRYAIAEFIEKDSLAGLAPYVLVYAGALVLQFIVAVYESRCAMHIEMYAGRDMRRDLFRHLQTLSLSYYNVTPVGYIITRVMSDTNRIAGMMAWQFMSILSELC